MTESFYKYWKSKKTSNPVPEPYHLAEPKGTGTWLCSANRHSWKVELDNIPSDSPNSSPSRQHYPRLDRIIFSNSLKTTDNWTGDKEMTELAYESITISIVKTLGTAERVNCSSKVMLWKAQEMGLCSGPTMLFSPLVRALAGTDFPHALNSKMTNV